LAFLRGRQDFLTKTEMMLSSKRSYPLWTISLILKSGAFYVGITRARHKCYIIADPTAPSDFITELLTPKYDLQIVSETFKERYRKMFKCPYCESGYLRLVKGQFGDFTVVVLG
jgi:hypothetical protein